MKLFTALALVANAAAASTDDAATPARLLRQNGSTADLVEAVHTVTDVAVQVQADADKVRIAYFVKNCCPNCHLSHMFEHHYCSYHHHVHSLHLSLYTAPTQWIEDRRFLRDCEVRRMSWYGWRSIAGEVQ